MFKTLLSKKTAIAPLLTFRILFGAVMLFGALRFVHAGWVEKLYLTPRFFFKFYGFEWVQPLGEMGMYVLFGVVILSSFLVMIGCFYRVAIITFFLAFTYIELIDASNYLNHYYLVCLLAFILIFLPANRAFSVDAWWRPKMKTDVIPAWCIYIIMVQLSIVYTYAGIAKLNPDWLFRAMPLSAWLPEHPHLPIIGTALTFKTTAFIFSWLGALYDLSIAYFLWYKRTRVIAYLAVVLFHLMTGVLFNIGLFPLIMISSTLIFFSGDFHERLLGIIGYRPYKKEATLSPIFARFAKIGFRFFILLQFVLPLRHHLYPGNVLWTEEGYRFSWRVMLVEKSGQAIFYVKDSATGRQTEIINGKYLTPFQEKQMSIQPDFMLQFAHFLKEEYESNYQYQNPIITVNAFVALNGRASEQLIDPTVNLAKTPAGLMPKKWILKHDF